MKKIGRNEPCPCGSGKKYKQCCLKSGRLDVALQQNANRGVLARLQDELGRLRQNAARREASFRAFGVFLLFSTTEGDAWFLEITESDAARVAQDGEAVDLSLEEQGEHIVINWSHAFSVTDRKLHLRSYATHETSVLPLAPVQQIFAAIRRVKKRYDPTLLQQIHASAAVGE